MIRSLAWMPLVWMLWWLPSVAVAAPVDLSGTWVLDVEASDSMDELMKARGIGWMKRKVAAGLTVTQVVVQSGDTLQLEVKSAAQNESMTLHVDGVPRETSTTEGPSEVSNRWTETGLETRSASMRDANGEPQKIEARIVRTLEDGGATMRQHMEVRIDGTMYAVNRIFRRAAAE